MVSYLQVLLYCQTNLDVLHLLLLILAFIELVLDDIELTICGRKIHIQCHSLGAKVTFQCVYALPFDCTRVLLADLNCIEFRNALWCLVAKDWVISIFQKNHKYLSNSLSWMYGHHFNGGLVSS